MGDIKHHKDLIVWQDSVNFVVDIYNITNSFPKEEVFGLTSQIRRSVVSIPSNIAEGAARNSNVEFKRFLNIALASLAEVETQVEIAYRLNYVSDTNKIEEKITKIRNFIVALSRKL